MSMLDDIFSKCGEPPPEGLLNVISGTLTIQYNGGGRAGSQSYTANSARVSHAPGTPAQVGFTMDGSLPGSVVQVTLSQEFSSLFPQQAQYGVALTFPSLPDGTFNSALHVDATSGVVYGSEPSKFVVLVLAASLHSRHPISP